MDRKTAIRTLGLAGYFLVAFLVFLFTFFPFDRVASRISAEVSRTTPLDLSIGHVSPRFFNRFSLRDVVIADKNGSVLFESPSAHAAVSLLNLLRGVLSVKLRAETYGGEILIRFQESSGRRSVLCDANGLDIASYPLLEELGYKVAGTLGGNVEIDGNGGNGRIWVKNLATRELKVQGFPVPDLDFGSGWVEGELKGDWLTIKKLELDGKELSVRVSGDMVLRAQGMLNLQIKLKPSERLAREQAGLLSFLKNRDADGFYQFTLGGTMAAPFPRL